MAGFGTFGSFLGGFNQETSRIRQENQLEDQRRQQRQDAIFNALANSDDPDVRAAAVTGLLTGDHPGGWFDKFLGKHQSHPAYEQIKELVANGHQPFLSEEEKTLRHARGQAQGSEQGRVGGALQALYEGTGEWPDADTAKQLTMGSMNVGRASTAQRPDQRGVVDVVGEDGQRRSGVAVVSRNGVLYEQGSDENGQPILTPIKGQASNWRTQAAAPPRAGGSVPTTKWTPGVVADVGQVPGRRSPGGWRHGIKPNGEEVWEPANLAPPTFSYIPTTEGIMVGNNRAPGVTPAPGGANLQAPTTPSTAASSTRALVDQILRMHPAPKGMFGAQPSARDQAAWQAGVDAEAKRMGYESFAALQAQVGAATQTVTGTVPSAGAGAVPTRTPPPPTPPPAPVRGRGGRTAAPPNAGAGAGAGAADPLGIGHLLP